MYSLYTPGEDAGESGEGLLLLFFVVSVVGEGSGTLPRSAGSTAHTD